MSNRRNFLKMLGIGAAVVPATAVAQVVSECNYPVGEPVQAFKFACYCGESIVAKVPKDYGTSIPLRCGNCKQWEYLLTWKGNAFTVREFQVST